MEATLGRLLRGVRAREDVQGDRAEGTRSLLLAGQGTTGRRTLLGVLAPW
jgi:hypothetical protein